MSLPSIPIYRSPLLDLSLNSGSSSSSTSSTTSSSSDSASGFKRTRLLDSTLPSVALEISGMKSPQASRLMALPSALTVHALSYLPFDDLMVSRATCYFIDRISVLAGTHYVFARDPLKFTDEVFAACMTRVGRYAHLIRVLDLSKTTVTKIHGVLREQMPNLTTLSIPRDKHNQYDTQSFIKDQEKICELLSQYPTLTSLDLTGLLNGNIQELSNKNLTHLNLCRCFEWEYLEEEEEDYEPFVAKKTAKVAEIMTVFSRNLPQLEWLSLKGNSYIYPSVISSLVFPKLKFLNTEMGFEKDGIEGEKRNMPKTMADLSLNCPNLEHLIVDNQFSNLETLKLMRLSTLELESRECTVKEMEVLSVHLPTLTSLKLKIYSWHGRRGGGYALDLSLINFPMLENLDLKGRRFPSDKAIEILEQDFLTFVKNHPKLHSLKFKNASLSEGMLKNLIYLENLRKLKLALGQIDDKKLKIISDVCKKLTSLNFSNSFTFNEYIGVESDTEVEKRENILTSEGLRVAIFPELTRLNLAHCNHISDLGMRYISQNYPKLTYLNLDRNNHKKKSLTGLSLQLISLPSLTEFNIQGYGKLENFYLQLIVDLMRRCPNLSNLNSPEELQERRYNALSLLGRSGSSL